MREINIDLSDIKSEYDGGFMGEHSATKLNVDISSFVEEDISFYIFRFETSVGDVLESKMFYQSDLTNNILSLSLWQKVCQCSESSFVIVGYKDEENSYVKIKKSEKIKLTFAPSIMTEGEELNDEHDSILEDIEKKLKAVDEKLNKKGKLFYESVLEYVVEEEKNEFSFELDNLGGEIFFDFYFQTLPSGTPNTNIIVTFNDKNTITISQAMITSRPNDFFYTVNTSEYGEYTVAKNGDPQKNNYNYEFPKYIKKMTIKTANANVNIPIDSLFIISQKVVTYDE